MTMRVRRSDTPSNTATKSMPHGLEFDIDEFSTACQTPPEALTSTALRKVPCQKSSTCKSDPG